MKSSILLIPLLLSTSAAWSAPPRSNAAKAPEASGPVRLLKKASGPVWLTSLAEGEAQARKAHLPLLVKVDAEFCVWCKKLDEEFARPEVKSLLAQFVLVKLDAGRDADAAERLRIGGTPALRVLAPGGRLVASQDGFLPADELKKWLTDRQAEAVAVPEADLATSGPPGLLDVVRIVRLFKHRDATLREAAMTRLRPFPKESSAATVAALRDGNLQTRLAALELLQSWQAPTSELDPWRPETLTKDRLAAIDAWVQQIVVAEKAPIWEPNEADWAAAEREIDVLLTASDAESVVIRERLAKFGAKLLPSVIRRLQAVDDDVRRERLTALRYRLIASQSRVVDWPGGIERLASRNLDERRRAVDELTRNAEPDDEPLLLELFGDADPLVRELSLRGLHVAAGEGANKALVKMLDDPEPNVRAAVLKQWAEHPTPQLLIPLKKYVSAEQDADLLVHAVRVLRALKAGSSPILISLFGHKAWQVRAEAAEALAEILNDHGGEFSGGDGAERKADAYAAFLNLLDDDDGFVVSRAVEGLRRAELPAAAKPLLALAEANPELTPTVVTIVAESNVYRRASATKLLKYTKHESPAVRAAAVAGIAQDLEIECEPELVACLADSDSVVRIAAAGGVWNRSGALRRAESDNGGFHRDVEAPVVSEERGFMSRIVGSLFDDADKKDDDKKIAERKDDEKKDPEKKDPAKPAIEKRPESPFAAPLRKMLDAPDQEESTAAAVAMAGIGLADEVLPRLEAAVRKDNDLIYRVSQVLPTLDWDRRVKLFQALVDADPEKAAGNAAYYLSQDHDERVVDLLWSLVNHPRMKSEAALGLIDEMKGAYLGEFSYDPSRASPAGRKRLKADATARLKRGSGSSQTFALALLAIGDADEGLTAARDVLQADVVINPELRQLAMRVVLLIADPSEGRQAALWALDGDEPDFYGPALALLLQDSNYLTQWEGHGYFLSELQNHLDYNRRFQQIASSSNPFDPAKPNGLTSARLRRAAVLTSLPEAEFVHYFRILLDETEDLGPLVRGWETSPDDDTLRRLLVRATAYLDDPANLSILERVYAKLKQESPSELGDFYWTIRIMNGPEIMQFRKRMRDEMGIEQFR